MDIKGLEQLRTKVQSLNQKRDQAQGALAELMRRLKSEFGCSTVKEGKRLHARLKREADEAEQEFEKELSRINREYADVLKDD